MGKQRLRNWILNNPFFQYQGQFSKSAFIAMNTWALVIFKYIISGFSYAYTKAVVAGTAPVTFSYTAKFDHAEAIALLTIAFGLYFGGKFSPTGNPVGVETAAAMKAVRETAVQDVKDIRADAAKDIKDIKEGA